MSALPPDNPYEAPREELVAPPEEPIVVPATLGGKLALSFQLLFGNLPLIAAVVLTVWLPANILIELALAQRPDSDNPLVSMRLNQFIEGIFGPIVSGGVIAVLAERLDGRRATYRAAMGVGLRNWGRLFAARFVARLLIVLGLIALVVPGIILAIRYALIDPVVVLEGARVSESRARSTALVRGRGWQVLFASVIVFVILSVTAFGTGVLVEHLPTQNNVPGAVAADCASDLVGVLFDCVLFLFYCEGRARELSGKTMPLAESPLLPAVGD